MYIFLIILLIMPTIDITASHQRPSSHTQKRNDPLSSDSVRNSPQFSPPRTLQSDDDDMVNIDDAQSPTQDNLPSAKLPSVVSVPDLQQASQDPFGPLSPNTRFEQQDSRPLYSAVTYPPRSNSEDKVRTTALSQTPEDLQDDQYYTALPNIDDSFLFNLAKLMQQQWGVSQNELADFIDNTERLHKMGFYQTFISKITDNYNYNPDELKVILSDHMPQIEQHMQNVLTLVQPTKQNIEDIIKHLPSKIKPSEITWRNVKNAIIRQGVIPIQDISLAEQDKTDFVQKIKNFLERKTR